ncbi:SMI1/KNR4 family protein [Kordia jejudonensis]|uniref:SMI1/KNR4 family protein n=1 Tax=Kordia jejudonensis TaxID=1348245 RepID=UPI000629A280|nr:SMI1/KNR4 family protein [Kordia jejudonensis]
MPFPVEEKYILNTASELNVTFPVEFIKRMMQMNGGELILKNYEIELYPFFDTSNRKRISRTCNHIALETKNAREWTGFPANAIAIGTDGFGNQVVLIHEGNGNLTDTIYLWNHQTKTTKKIAESINDVHNSLWKRMKTLFKI